MDHVKYKSVHFNLKVWFKCMFIWFLCNVIINLFTWMQYVEICIKFKKHQICHCRQSILVNRTPLLWWCTPSASDLEIPTEWVCNCWRWLKKFVGDSSRSLFEMAWEVFFSMDVYKCRTFGVNVVYDLIVVWKQRWWWYSSSSSSLAQHHHYHVPSHHALVTQTVSL